MKDEWLFFGFSVFMFMIGATCTGWFYEISVMADQVMADQIRECQSKHEKCKIIVIADDGTKAK